MRKLTNFPLINVNRTLFVSIILWGHGGMVVNTLDFRSEGPCHRIVSLDKKLYPTLSLSTQVYNWVPATYCWGNPAMDYHPIQGEVAIFSVALCYRNRDTLRPRGPPWLVYDFTFSYLIALIKFPCMFST